MSTKLTQTVPTPSPSVRKLGLASLKPRHREIARRMLFQKQSEIARDLNMSQSRLSIIVNSDLMKLEIARLEQLRDAETIDIQSQIAEINPSALAIKEQLMYTTKSDNLKDKIATDFLAMGGHGPIKKLDARVQNIPSQLHKYSKDELKDLLLNQIRRAREETQLQQQRAADAAAIELDFEDCDTPSEPDLAPIELS